jgi:hypothetical protein
MSEEFNKNFSDIEFDRMNDVVDDSEEERIYAEDEYADFDDVCELHQALIEYTKKHNLLICENLNAHNLYNFLKQ